MNLMFNRGESMQNKGSMRTADGMQSVLKEDSQYFQSARGDMMSFKNDAEIDKIQD